MKSNPRHLKIAALVVVAVALLWSGINVYAGKRADVGYGNGGHGGGRY